MRKGRPGHDEFVKFLSPYGRFSSYRHPDGSKVAFWLVNGPDAGAAPIVHFGSEGNEYKLLAKDFREFLRLFAMGYRSLGFSDLDSQPEEPESAQHLREWISSTCSLSLPTTGAEIVTSGRFGMRDSL